MEWVEPIARDKRWRRAGEGREGREERWREGGRQPGRHLVDLQATGQTVTSL